MKIFTIVLIAARNGANNGLIGIYEKIPKRIHLFFYYTLAILLSHVPRTSAKERRLQVELIAKKLSTGFTDTDIMNQLNVKRATFYHYKKLIYQVWGDIARRKTEESIAFEADLMKDRLIRIYRGLELRLNDSKNDPIRDVAEASAIATQIATAIFKLDYEGIKATRYLRGVMTVEQEGLSRITDLGNLPAELPESTIYTPEYTEPESTFLQANDPSQQSSNSEEKVF